MATISDYEKLEDDEIVTLVDKAVRQSIGYYDSDLSRERSRVTQYYNGTLPLPAHDGNSRYVSQDVFNAVQSMSAALLETFSSGNKICRFAPQNADDTENAAICTSYTDYVIFRQNNFYETLRSVILDGLLARAGAAKVFWQESTATDLEEFTDITQDELDMLLAQNENIELEDSETDDFGMLSGTIAVTRDTSQVVIESVPPEELLVESQCVSLETAQFVAHRTRKTLSELREMGVSEKQIEDIGNSHDDVEMETDTELLARHDEIGSHRGVHNLGLQDQVRSIMVYEAYITLDVEGDGVAKLHRVLKAGNSLLEIEEASRIPFCTFVPLPIPHCFYGSNFADKIIPTQNARTVLTRSILDHAVITNNPRYMVVKGSMSSPRELIDNRVGGIVNVSRPDGIMPLPQASLNPFIFQTLDMLDANSEDNTGVSRLSTGMNKDAISKQNSAAMVEQLATMSQQRQKIIARNLASQFIKPLFHLVYQLCLENEKQEKIVELSGSYVSIQPSAWEDKRDVMVELRLGYGEQEKEAQKLLGLHQMFSQDPTIQPMYSTENTYYMLKNILEQQGILNVEDYLTPPDQLPEPQPDPAQEMQMEMAQKQLELQERQQALAEQKAQMDSEMDQMKMEMEQMKAQASHALASDNMDLKEAQLEHKRRIDEGELAILKRTDDVRGIVSPTG